MATFLFDDIIFGPVKSRRLGASLGINLLPTGRKFCNFNCLYCECGWSSGAGGDMHLPSRESIREKLFTRLSEIKTTNSPLDRITFAGNGEPTIHPDFPGIIEDTITVRDNLFPGVKIAVLSNASTLDKPGIFNALGRIEMNILKLDSVNEQTVRLINQPPAGYRVSQVIDGFLRFKGKFILQTLFVTGHSGDVPIDNASTEEVNNWLDMIQLTRPETIMIYTIDRDTPLQTLQKVPREQLDSIARQVRKLGLSVQVSY